MRKKPAGVGCVLQQTEPSRSQPQVWPCPNNKKKEIHPAAPPTQSSSTAESCYLKKRRQKSVGEFPAVKGVMVWHMNCPPNLVPQRPAVGENHLPNRKTTSQWRRTDKKLQLYSEDRSVWLDHRRWECGDDQLFFLKHRTQQLKEEFSGPHRGLDGRIRVCRAAQWDSSFPPWRCCVLWLPPTVWKHAC